MHTLYSKLTVAIACTDQVVLTLCWIEFVYGDILSFILPTEDEVLDQKKEMNVFRYNTVKFCTIIIGLKHNSPILPPINTYNTPTTVSTAP